MLDERTRFSRNAVVLITIGYIPVILLGFFEEQRWISRETEGLVRFVFGFVTTSVIAVLALRTPLSRVFRVVIVLGCLSAQCGQLLSYTEDVPRLDDVQLIGRNSEFRRVMKPVFSGVWVLGVLFVAYASIHALHVLHTRSDQQIGRLEESESRARTANRQLKETIRELADVQQQLVEQERLRVIGEMASGMAHDLNNALTPLVASSQLLLCSVSPPTSKQRELGKLIETSAFDVASIVERIGHFHQRTDAGRRVPTNLKDLIQQIVVGTRPKWEIEPELRGVEISVLVDAEDLAAVVDPTEVRVVLTNLLFNSVQGMPDGGTIKINLRREGTNGILSVCDTGIGMTPDDVKRCFEPFFSTKSGGSGLGLTMCHRIVESYGASLHVESEVGAGTVVTFRLPLSDIPKSAGSAPDATVASQRILIVEDQDLVRDAIQEMLIHLGMDVTTVDDGEAAIAQVQDGRFDLIITDFGMKGMTGAEVVRDIRLLQPEQRIAVLSGWSETALQDRFHPGFLPDAVLEKPICLEHLRSLLAL